jgi:hypothetical protein
LQKLRKKCKKRTKIDAKIAKNADKLSKNGVDQVTGVTATIFGAKNSSRRSRTVDVLGVDVIKFGQ